MKQTKRKAFNFLRSYFDVLNELKEDSDKLSFLMSIINKQFLNKDPKDLAFIAKLCYESQRHSIESSVKGWIRANKTDLQGNLLDTPTTTLPTAPPTDPPTNPKEEEVQVQEEEIIIYPSFSDFWDLYDKKTDKPKSLAKWNKLTQAVKLQIIDYLPRYKLSQPDKQYRKNPVTFLNNESWNNELIINKQSQDDERQQSITDFTKAIRNGGVEQIQITGN